MYRPPGPVFLRSMDGLCGSSPWSNPAVPALVEISLLCAIRADLPSMRLRRREEGPDEDADSGDSCVASMELFMEPGDLVWLSGLSWSLKDTLGLRARASLGDVSVDVGVWSNGCGGGLASIMDEFSM